MNIIKTLMLSTVLMVMNGAAFAETESTLENNRETHLFSLTDNKMTAQRGVDTFNKILKCGGLYALLLSMNTELPDIAKTAEFVMLFNEINSTNQILSRLLMEMQKNNQLLRKNTPNKGVAMDG
ncbi:TPA: hypothetical protein NGG10_002751 [Legionella pneumophila]|nr:hypothetical protein [Legionella pneumophila]HAT3828195.1 hypothetical protein [Legionella pneumophila]HAU1392244.1 hypothetical protein [Legionella pneumophila]HAU2129210.1 hypothetical protein [Legionella pneumophila]HAU3984400.1 hypothetical protein [Legionella pneumophila]